MYIVAGCIYLRLNGIRKSIYPYIKRKFCGLLIFKGIYTCALHGAAENSHQI